ncbi:MAG: 30S ribosomal protein S1 [Selenomonadaceae bacterium]|nr:30S ribosomal protein S1 [Selenomonadaceae bacterium]
MLKAEEESMQAVNVGDVVEATVVAVENSSAMVTIAGLKSDIPIPKRELVRPEPDSAEDVVKVGDVIEVAIVSLGGENGATVSKVKADARVAWTEMEGIQERGETVQAQVSQVVKGGLVANVNGLRGFIPASQMELHFVKDLSVYVGQTVEVLPIEIDVHKQRLVLSRRQLLEAEREKKQEEVFATLEAGQTVRGTVKRIVDYGAFIDIGGVDGLAHISDISWERVKHPSDVLEVGQELDVYVKSVDPESKRISLSIKETMRDPWLDRAERYAEGDYIEGEVIKLTDFGAFMQIEPGFDGLIPMGELCDRRIERADEAVHVGDMVKVKVLRIDMKRKRISLSITKAKKDADTAVFKKYEAEQEDAPTTIGDEVSEGE